MKLPDLEWHIPFRDDVVLWLTVVMVTLEQHVVAQAGLEQCALLQGGIE